MSTISSRLHVSGSTLTSEHEITEQEVSPRADAASLLVPYRRTEKVLKASSLPSNLYSRLIFKIKLRVTTPHEPKNPKLTEEVKIMEKDLYLTPLGQEDVTWK